MEGFGQKKVYGMANIIFDSSKIKVAKPEEQLLKRNRDYEFEFQFRPN